MKACHTVRMRHIGIYSGTFDPAHIGHIAFADEAMKRAGLDHVVFLPEESPRGKVGVTVLPTRLGQLTKALQGTPHQVRCPAHARFTIDTTLAEIERWYPDATLHFLMGADVAASLAGWPDVGQLIARHRLIVGMRTGYSQAEVEQLLKRLETKYLIVSTVHADVSSRRLREMT